MTPQQLFDFAQENISSINFKYCITQQYNDNENHLATHFDDTQTVPGTHRFHTVISISQTKQETKLYSLITEKYMEDLIITDGLTANLKQIESGSIIIINYDGSWWLACILAKNQESREIEVMFLNPKRPTLTFTKTRYFRCEN